MTTGRRQIICYFSPLGLLLHFINQLSAVCGVITLLDGSFCSLQLFYTVREAGLGQLLLVSQVCFLSENFCALRTENNCLLTRSSQVFIESLKYIWIWLIV